MPVSMAEIQAVVTADTSGFDSGMTSAGQKVEQLGASATISSANVQKAGAGMAAFGAIGVAAFGSAVDAAAGFQQELDIIGSVGGEAAIANMDAIQAAALQMGAETQFSAMEAAKGMEELVKAGMPVQTVLDGAARSSLDLAAAGGVSVVDAASAMSQALNVYGKDLDATMSKQEQATHTADLFAQVANASATGVNEIAAGFGNAAPVAHTFGLSMDETAQAIGLMSNAGIDGAEAGTMLKSMLLSLNTPTKAQKAAMSELGLSYSDLIDESGNLISRDGMGGVATMFDTLNKAAAENGVPMGQVKEDMATIFGSYGITAATTFFDVQEQGWATLQDGMTNAGSAAEQAAVRQGNLAGHMEALGGSIDTIAIIVGTALIPAIDAVVGFLTALANGFISLPEPIQTAVAVLGAIAAAVSSVGGALILATPVITAMGAGFGTLAALAAPVALPILAIVAAIAALKIAYDTNFLGFADGVNAALGGLTSAFGNFVLLIQNVAAAFGEGGLGAALAVIGDAFATLAVNLPGMLQAASDAVMTWVQTLSTNIMSAFNTIDWAAVGAALLNGVTSAIGLIVGLDVLMAQKAVEIVTGLVQGVAEHWPDVVAAIQTGMTALGEAITSGAPVLLAAMQAGWTAIQDAVAPAWQTIQTTVSTAVTAIQTAISDAMTGIQQAVSAAWVTIQNDISARMTGIQEGLTTAWETLQAFIGEKLTAIQTAVTTIWAALPTPIQDAMTAIGAAITTGWATIQTTIGAALAEIQTGVSLAWDAIQTAVSNVLGTLQSGIAAAFDAIVTTVTTAGESIKTGFVTAITNMGTEAIAALGGVKDAIVGVFADAGTWLLDAGGQIVQGLIDGITSRAGEVAGAVQSIIPTNIGAPTSDWANGIGQLIPQGMANGITAGTPAVEKAATTMANSASIATGSALMTHSPSRVFYQIGLDVTQGFANGLDSGSADTTQRSRRLGEDVSTSFAGGIADGAADAISAMADLMANIKSTLKASLKEIRSIAGDALANFWGDRMTKAPEFFESIPAMTQMAVDAATNEIDRLKAYAAGTQLQIDWLKANDGPADQIAALTSAQGAQQLAVWDAMDAAAVGKSKGLQRQIHGEDNPAQKAALRAELALQQQQIGVLDQLQGAQLEFNNATTDMAREVAQVKIDSLTAQLQDLQSYVVDTSFDSLADQFDQLIADMVQSVKDARDATGVDDTSDTDGGRKRHRSAGGSVATGLSYWVGERGPEPFIPATNGRILSHGDAMAAMAGGGGGTIVIQTLNLPGVQDVRGFLDELDGLLDSRSVSLGRGVS